MRGLVLLLALCALSAAQFDDTDARLAQCQQGCCSRMSGEWNGSVQECTVGSSDYNDYYRCRNECLEIASRDYGAIGGGAGICCAPAFLLLGLTLVVSRH